MYNLKTLESLILDFENQPDSHGHVETGNHSVYDFEVYQTDKGLRFQCHEEPGELDTYDSVKQFFTERGDDLDKQLKAQGLL